MLTALFLFGWAFAAAAPMPTTVDVALVIAVDVSQSMDRDELEVQRSGYVAALRDPAFLRAVLSGRAARIAVAYVEWAGTVRRESSIPWQIVDDAASADRLAASISAVSYGSFRGTSISGALAYATAAFDASSLDASRRVIDISGDGPNNFGPPVTAARDRAVAAGIVVNGLPILIRPSPTFPAIDRYYDSCVIGGPGSFVMPVRNVSEFETAIRRKLILEVSGGPGAAGVTAVAEEPVDCLVGEKLRRALSDRFYPELDP